MDPSQEYFALQRPLTSLRQVNKCLAPKGGGHNYTPLIIHNNCKTQERPIEASKCFFFSVINFAQSASVGCQKGEGPNMAIHKKIQERRNYLHITLALSLGRHLSGQVEHSLGRVTGDRSSI